MEKGKYEEEPLINNGNRSSKFDQVFRIKPSEDSLVLARRKSPKNKVEFKKDLEYHHLVWNLIFH